MTSTSLKSDQTILDFTLFSTKLISDMIPVERTLLVIGNKNAGKTTLIHKFFDKSENPKSTLALEYSFARRSGKSLTKDICHVWELGGGLIFKDLLSVIIEKTKGRRLSVVLVLDLSRPDVLWNTMEMFLEEVRKQLGNVPDIEGYDQYDVQNVEDKKFMSPFPVPLMIVGSKYDIYQDLEPAKKRVFCQCLRYAAHTYGASLVFYSTKDAMLAKRCKEMMSHYGFGTHYPNSCVQDPSKPLLVCAGNDSFEQIDDTDRSGSVVRSTHEYKNLFASSFDQIASQELDQRNDIMSNTNSTDPMNDPNYADPLIDQSLKTKREELKLFVDNYERFLNTENTKNISDASSTTNNNNVYKTK